jgi:hypothetical protein
VSISALPPLRRAPCCSVATNFFDRTDLFEHNSRLPRSRPRQPEFERCSEPANNAVPHKGVDLSNPLSPLTFNPSESELPSPLPCPFRSAANFSLSILDPSLLHPLQRALCKAGCNTIQEQRRSSVPLESPLLPSPLPASAGLIWLVITGIYPIAKRPCGLD